MRLIYYSYITGDRYRGRGEILDEGSLLIKVIVQIDINILVVGNIQGCRFVILNI